MNKKLKYTLFTLGAIGLGFGVYFTIRYFKLKAAYSTILTEKQALEIINDAANEFDENDIDYDEAMKEFGIDKDKEETGVKLGEENDFDDFWTMCEQDPEYCEQILNEI